MSKLVKIHDLLNKVQKFIESGDYLFTGHANQRLQEREISRLEVKQVLLNGFHEKKKDSFDETFNSWNYSIRGKTLDDRELRVIISFEDGLLVITVIDLKR